MRVLRDPLGLSTATREASKLARTAIEAEGFTQGGRINLFGMLGCFVIMAVAGAVDLVNMVVPWIDEDPNTSDFAYLFIGLTVFCSVMLTVLIDRDRR